jgi:hypothetical protein
MYWQILVKTPTNKFKENLSVRKEKPKRRTDGRDEINSRFLQLLSNAPKIDKILS